VLADLTPRERDVSNLSFVQVLAEKILRPLLLVGSVGGGTGKTTILATLARCLADKNERVSLAESLETSLLPFYFGGQAEGWNTM
jgi:hypothetical protein